MSGGVDRVREALVRSGLDPEIRSFPQGTHTAADAAAAIGVAVGQIVKSLVFALPASGGLLLVLTSGANRVDEARVGALIGEPIARADPGRVRAETGFAIGGVPPVGHAGELRTLVDEDLLAFGEVWASAGTPRDVFAIDPRELVRAAGGEVAPVATEGS